MNDQQLIAWLLSDGGPALRYRAARELAEGWPTSESQEALAVLLRTERVQWLLRQMDEPPPLDHIDIAVLNTLHGMKPTCLENVIPRLLELGLHAGVSVLDDKMERLRQYVTNPLVCKAMDEPNHPTVEGARAVFLAIVFASCFMRGGYYFADVLEFVRRRIRLLSRAATDSVYAIHLCGSELAGLPKQWIGKPILRPELDPTLGTSPLPLIHDFYALAYSPAGSLSADEQAMVDAIATYGTSEQYRAFPPGYGYLWGKANPRTCYSCGWNLDLPDVDAGNPFEQRKIVQRLDLLARLPAARESSWFRKGMRFMEEFRAADGVYAFPRSYLVESKAGYYVGGDYMGLEESRRPDKALALESTFRMLLLQRLVRTTAYTARQGVRAGAASPIAPTTVC